MDIVRYLDTEGYPRVGVRNDGRVTPLPWAPSIAEVLRQPLAVLRERLEESTTTAVETDVAYLPPVDGRTEVWASGVTYARSRDARMEESTEQSVYDRVYEAERPELFFKALPWRVVTDGDPIGIRADSPLNVPEPELAVFVNSAREIVGYGVCDDVSSRTIEGENPLYLPQAKVYAGSCALATGIRPAWEVDASCLDIVLEVHRDSGICFEGKVNTSTIRREFDVLVEYLFRGQPFPDGAVLATGTGIVPELDFTLREGDLVRIEVSGVGTLSNRVTTDRSALDQLMTRTDRS